MSLHALAQELAAQGRGGDTMLAHITPEEASLLKALGGSGTINPDTGLPEFFLKGLRSIVSKVGGGISDLVSGAGDVVGGVVEAARDAGRDIDDFVNDEIPGGWGTVALATGAAMGGVPGLGGSTAGAAGSGSAGSLAAADAVYAGATTPLWETSLANAAGAGAGAAGAGGVADLLGSTDQLDYMNLGSGAGGDYGIGAAGAAAGLGAAAGSGLGATIGNFLSSPLLGNLTGGGALLGAAGLYKLIDMMKEDNKRFGTPGRQDYTGGALSKFKYDPSSFTPTTADPSRFRPQSNIPTLNQEQYRQPATVPQIADETAFVPTNNSLQDVKQRIDALDLDEKFKSSGIGSLLKDLENLPEQEQQINDSGIGGNTARVFKFGKNSGVNSGIGSLFKFSEGGKTKRPELTSKAKLAALDPYLRAIAEMNNAAYGARMPVGMRVPSGNVSQMGQFQFAQGGISHLGDYSDGGRLLKGPGDGVSDSIPATIGDKQPARLADGEFVVPARIVSELGNGSTDAGARKLYAMMDRVQKARGKTTGKGKVAKNTRADKYLPA